MSVFFLRDRLEKKTIHALMCGLLLAALDVHFYFSGLSWTFLHYETLLPLTACMASGFFGIIAAWGCAIFVGGLLVLYFEFGLTFSLAQTSFYFSSSALVIFLFWTCPTLMGALTIRRIPLLFLLCLFSAITFDKLILRDQFASSFLLHFFEIGETKEAIPSDNFVYKNAKEALQNGRGVVLIVFESLGVPLESGKLLELQEEYSDFSMAEIMHEGGSTVSAELRYLCGVNGGFVQSSDCLPNGRHSLALHGNSLSYFNRYSMYRRMGFEELRGKHEEKNAEECNYAYNAVCDSALLDVLRRKISDKGCEGFYYMLSIDSHFPYEKYGGDAKGMFKDLSVFLKVARDIKNAYPECQIIIAGDHPPPLASGFKRDKVMMVSSVAP